MFSFLKKNPSPPATPADYGALQVDMHSHLLPGIDDGSPDMDTTLQLIRRLQAMGYRKLITTPHIYWDYYRNTPAIIHEQLALVRQALAAEGLDVELDAAAEYFLDEHFEQELQDGTLLTLPGRHVLVEMSFFAPYPNLHQTLFNLRSAGYRPILAHPERYLYLAGDFGQFDRIRSYGCALQVNILSLSGHYGKPVKNLALQLLEHNLVDFLGTDLHHARHADTLDKLRQESFFKRILEKHTFKNQEWLINQTA